MPSQKYQICTNYIMIDTTDSKIIFGEKEVCEYCNNYYSNIVPVWNRNERGGKKIWEVTEKIQIDGGDKDHDCLSGGVGSSFFTFVAKNKVKYILTEANYYSEYVREPLAWHYHSSDLRQLKDIHKRFGMQSLGGFPLAGISRVRIYYRFIKGVRVVKPLNYVPYCCLNYLVSPDCDMKSITIKKIKSDYFEIRSWKLCLSEILFGIVAKLCDM